MDFYEIEQMVRELSRGRFQIMALSNIYNMEALWKNKLILFRQE